MEAENHMVISIDVKIKTFGKNPAFYHDKNIQQTRNIKELPQLDKRLSTKNTQLTSYLRVKD